LFKGKRIPKIKKALEKLTKYDGLEKYIQLLNIFNELLKVKDREYLSLKTNHNIKFEKDLEKLNKVYKYVFENIQEGIELDNISKHMGMAPTSFCRYFKKKTNAPFMQYVKNVRISIAAKMLVETDKSITQICYDSGYNNLANFNHYFKTTMGKTPSQYRKSFEE
jgi:AraC-like DNA-binding protein